MKKVYLSLGSNLGMRRFNLYLAVHYISNLQFTKLIKVSNIYETIPFNVPDKQPMYLNMCVLILTLLSPFELLEKLQLIEKKLGRKRYFKYSQRTIDIDIILMESTIIDSDNLKIPHPLMFERSFVLDPLKDIFEI